MCYCESHYQEYLSIFTKDTGIFLIFLLQVKMLCSCVHIGKVLQ